MKRFIIAAAAVALLTVAAKAQDVKELAQQYVDMPEVQEMMTQTFSPETLGQQMAANLPPNIRLTSDQQAAMGALMSKEMNALRPRMEELMVTYSAETFSAAELRALIDFYQSEHGASVMAKMNTFMTNIMGELAPEMRMMQEKVMPQLLEILQGK